MKIEKKILMVCLGNICRSPLAHGIMQQKIEEYQLPWEVDSAGTSGFHNGEQPDPRSIEEANLNGIDISSQTSRQITTKDIDYYNLILVMDSSNYKKVLHLCVNEKQKDKVKMILDYTYPGEHRGVPDPYYEDGFDDVFYMLEAAIDHMIELEWGPVGDNV